MINVKLGHKDMTLVQRIIAPVRRDLRKLECPALIPLLQFFTAHTVHTGAS